MTNAAARAELFDSVRAKFGGREITFKIKFDDLSAFEAYVREPAYQLFRTIAAGAWTVRQVKAVLRFAMLPSARVRHYAMIAEMDMNGRSPPLSKPDHIDAVFASNPVAVYAGLALNVLGGALFGLDADAAVFDDGVPLAFNNGLADFKRRLAALPKAAKTGVVPALDRSADELVATQRRLAPRDDGKLAASIRWSKTGELSRQVEAGGESTTRQVGGGLYPYDYALAQEFGTENMPAQPFFWPGYRLTKKRIRSRIKRAISKSVKEAYGK